MRIIADLHTHTLVSKHAFGTINEMVTEAIDKHLSALAITDHTPSSVDGGNIQIKSLYIFLLRNYRSYLFSLLLLTYPLLFLLQDYNTVNYVLFFAIQER